MEKLYSPADCRTAVIKRVVTLALGLSIMTAASDAATPKNVLIYTKNGQGYIHDNIAASVNCLKNICTANGWSCQVSDDSSLFDDAAKIKAFDVLVFSNSNNDAFDNDSQRKVFREYIQGGGAFVGIHSACGSERNWPWFWANLGGKFVRHPKLQKFEIAVIDKAHPSTAHLGKTWQWEDEFYYLNELNPGIHVLLAGDMRTLDDDRKAEYPGRIFGDYFPLAWCQEFDGGRQWYTALGHKIEYYQDANFIKHLEGGLQWAMKVRPAAAKAAGTDK